MLDAVTPHCVFIGVPPGAHGCSEQPIELVCAKAKVHMFIEKPYANRHIRSKTLISCFAG